MHNVTVAFAVLLVMLLSYFFGCFNGSFMVSHFIIRDDVRKHGSGNAGLTNFYRTYGAKYALLVIACDMGKTVAACLLGSFFFRCLGWDGTLGTLLAGLGCELGHIFPVFYGLRGGKGILSGGTLVLLLNWRVAAVAWALFLLLCAITCLRCGELKKTLARGGLYLFVIALCIFILYPFYVMLITGFRSNAETTDMYFLHMMPTKWIWSNLKDICDRGVLRFLLNSIMLSTGATAIAMLCGIPAAYAMARMHFKGRSLFLGFVIMSQMFSPVVLLVGISQLMNALHLNDTILGLMLINAAFNQAFAIWLLRGTFVSISPEMEQAACIDGCNTVGALWNILLPMAAPGIVTTLIFVFINSWNEYTISTVLISTPTNKPITVGITQFSSFNMIEWQYLFAAALLATIPVIILFMCIEKHLAEGLTSGGVKG